jgi:pyruvate, water dikinase
MSGITQTILFFSEINTHDESIVGKKGIILGNITQAGFPVPPGFVVSTKAYFQFLKKHNLIVRINQLISTINFDQPESLMQISNQIKKIILSQELSDSFIKDIDNAYTSIGEILGNALVSVCSTIILENTTPPLLIGKEKKYASVIGEANLLLKIKEAWTSLFEPELLKYRHDQQIDHFQIGIAVIIQKLILSQKSGLLFTIDPITNDKAKIIIEAIYGLSEMIRQDRTTPDHYEIMKNDLSLVNKITAHQKTMLITKNGKIIEVTVPQKDLDKQILSQNQLIELALLGKKLEQHYYFPQEIEWAIDQKKIYIIQKREITATKNQFKESKSKITDKLLLLLKGTPASPGIVSGPVKIIQNPTEIIQITKGDILVIPQTHPRYIPAMKKAAAIITNIGGRTSHTAIISRELGIPAVVGTEIATQKLLTGQIVTVSGTKGEIYKGSFLANTHSDATSPLSHLKTATKVYVNLSQSGLAQKVAKKNVDGVGLLRAEFIMADMNIHPKELIRNNKKHIYIHKLVELLEQFCKAFAPRPIIFRTSDYKSNEYRKLQGGEKYEPIEPNPLLGYRGAYRYINEPEMLELELEAIKIIRNKKNLKNLWMMIPFVRNVRELIDVKRIISFYDLHRSPTFKLWMMVEVPSNVILLDKFIEAGIDGVSLGTNDLTMLLLGTDRDNSEVSQDFNTSDPAVLWAIERTIKTAHKHHIPVSICGQAPSQYPSLVEKLVSWGITSISVSPDMIDSVRETIAQTERKLIEKK